MAHLLDFFLTLSLVLIGVFCGYSCKLFGSRFNSWQHHWQHFDMPFCIRGLLEACLNQLLPPQAPNAHCKRRSYHGKYRVGGIWERGEEGGNKWKGRGALEETNITAVLLMRREGMLRFASWKKVED